MNKVSPPPPPPENPFHNQIESPPLPILSCPPPRPRARAPLFDVDAPPSFLPHTFRAGGNSSLTLLYLDRADSFFFNHGVVSRRLSPKNSLGWSFLPIMFIRSLFDPVPLPVWRRFFLLPLLHRSGFRCLRTPFFFFFPEWSFVFGFPGLRE